MPKVIKLLVLLSASFICTTDSARILVVVPTPSISHHIVFRILTQELAKRGHNVTVITPDPAFKKGETPENLKEIDVHDLSYVLWNRSMISIVTNGGEEHQHDTQVQIFNQLTLKIFEEQTKVAEVQHLLKSPNDSFDLLLIEAWPRFALGYSHAFKIPVIAVSSFGAVFDNNEVIGAVSHPLLYPQVLATRLYDLSIWDKISQLYHFARNMKNYNDQLELENIVVRRIFGANTPCLTVLQNNIQMMFLNIHPIWDDNRPVPPGVVYMGGLHINPQKKLPKDLKTYLDSSKHGVIYISFGTNVDTTRLATEKVQVIINTLEQLPYDVLWKWNGDKLPGRTKKINISKWFPQSDILRHPKIKLFITQAGLQSTDEAISGGVPLIAIPFLGDQWYNAEKYVYHKIGMRFDFQALQVESLKKGIETVIGDKSFRDNIIRLRSIMNDQPMTPLARAVWWTEHVLRHGGAPHLRARAANMPWTQYYEVNLILILLSVTLTFVFLAIKIIKLLLKAIVLKFSSKVKRS